MLPGKKYRPEDFLLILRHRIWLLLVPFAIVSAASAVWVRHLPDVYESQTLIMIMPQQVSEAYVKTTLSTSLEDRIYSIQQQILSRTRLEKLITDFNLYPDERANGIMQDVVDHMTRDIKVTVVRGDAFRVSFVGNDPVTVMKVTQQLGTLFINESQLDQANLADRTNQFLDAELESARQKLADRERQLAAYREKYAGELPSEQQSNLQAVQNIQMQIQSVLQSISQDQDRRVDLERQIQDLEAQPVAAPSGPVVDAKQPPTTLEQLEAARAGLAALQLRLKPEHPDVVRLKRVIADLEKKANAEALQTPLSQASAMAVSPAEAARQRKLADLHSELDQIKVRIDNEQQQEQTLRQRADQYQQRAEAAPTRETELISLTRDYGTLQQLYSSLLSKRENAQISSNLENRQIGETFRVIDPPTVPQRPISPNRPRLTQLGLLAGLAIGVGLIALVEYRDSTLKTDDDVLGVVGVAVLAVVPVMRSSRERHFRAFRRLATGLVLGSVVLACLAVLGYTLVR
jgi:protein tyrosine kinase modulator